MCSCKNKNKQLTKPLGTASTVGAKSLTREQKVAALKDKLSQNMTEQEKLMYLRLKLMQK